MSVTQSKFHSSAATGEWVPHDQEASSGDPRAELLMLRDQSGGDGVLVTGLWRAQPSVCIDESEGDDTFYMIKGEAELELDSGEKFVVKAGDATSLPKGTKAIWTILSPMEKFFVISG